MGRFNGAGKQHKGSPSPFCSLPYPTQLLLRIQVSVPARHQDATLSELERMQG